MQLVDAVSAIHAKGFAHSDLKYDNICVNTSRDDPLVTVIDFGICSRIEQSCDIRFIEMILTKFFPKDKRAPSLEQWLFAHGDDQALAGLPEALREQMTLEDGGEYLIVDGIFGLFGC